MIRHDNKSRQIVLNYGISRRTVMRVFWDVSVQIYKLSNPFPQFFATVDLNPDLRSKRQTVRKAAIDKIEAEKNAKFKLLEPKDVGIKRLLERFEDPWKLDRIPVGIAMDGMKINIENSSGKAKSFFKRSVHCNEKCKRITSASFSKALGTLLGWSRCLILTLLANLDQSHKGWGLQIAKVPL